MVTELGGWKGKRDQQRVVNKTARSSRRSQTSVRRCGFPSYVLAPGGKDKRRGGELHHFFKEIVQTGRYFLGGLSSSSEAKPERGRCFPSGEPPCLVSGGCRSPRPRESDRHADWCDTRLRRGGSGTERLHARHWATR